MAKHPSPRTLRLRTLREWRLQQERARAAVELRQSEERYRTLFENSCDALMTLAPPTWHFTSGNRAAIALFGATDEADFTAHTPAEYSPPQQPDGRDSAEKSFEMFERAMRDGSQLFDWVHRRCSGEDFPATVLLTRIELRGKVTLQATVRDDSGKRQLDARVAQADRLASMGMLAAGVAHEINNPLAYVSFNVESLAEDFPQLANAVSRCRRALCDRLAPDAYADVLGDAARQLEDPALADALDRIVEALNGTQRIREIMRGLGAFSHSESSAPSSIDISQPLHGAISMVRNELRPRARLVEELQPVARVWATEGKLSQVFLNLLVNAAHAIDEGHPDRNQITIRTYASDAQVCVAITDTGRGIANADLARIFEPFFTTKPVGVGTGLGLPICRNIIREFGGTLHVSSKLGEGSEFIVRLPAHEERQSTEPPELLPEIPRDPSRPRGRILVIDDEESVCNLLKRLLTRDHDVVNVRSGEEAQQLLEDDPAFDVILCDLMMSNMTGMAFHSWLAARDPWLANQVLFVTGGAFTPRAAAYLASVPNQRIDKPFDAEHLKWKVAELVRAARKPR